MFSWKLARGGVDYLQHSVSPSPSTPDNGPATPSRKHGRPGGGGLFLPGLFECERILRRNGHPQGTDLGLASCVRRACAVR